MKALEILKALSNGIIFAESLNIQIKEAITELEQLSSNSLQLKEENKKLHNALVDCVERYESVLNKQIIKENKTCEGCKWCAVLSSNCDWCERHPSRQIKNINIKDYWESK